MSPQGPFPEHVSATQSATHWCTQESLTLLAQQLDSYIQASSDHEGDEPVHWLMLLDCCPTHCSREWVEHMKPLWDDPLGVCPRQHHQLCTALGCGLHEDLQSSFSQSSGDNSSAKDQDRPQSVGRSPSTAGELRNALPALVHAALKPCNQETHFHAAWKHLSVSEDAFDRCLAEALWEDDFGHNQDYHDQEPHPTELTANIVNDEHDDTDEDDGALEDDNHDGEGAVALPEPDPLASQIQDNRPALTRFLALRIVYGAPSATELDAAANAGSAQKKAKTSQSGTQA